MDITFTFTLNCHRDPMDIGTGKKTPGGAGTHTRDTQDTRGRQTGTRVTQTNLTTIQTQRHIPAGTVLVPRSGDMGDEFPKVQHESRHSHLRARREF